MKTFLSVLWQSKRSWFSFVPGFSVSTHSTTSTAAIMDLIFCETGQVKMLKSKLFICLLFSCNPSLLNGQVNHYQGQYDIWHTCSADNLEKKTNMDPCMLCHTYIHRHSVREISISCLVKTLYYTKVVNWTS